MREMKFRGKRRVTNKPVYGDGVFKYPDTTETYIARSWVRPPIGTPIEEGTLEQLIGVDKNGAEIYEGDLIKPAAATDDFAYVASFADFRVINEKGVIKCVK